MGISIAIDAELYSVKEQKQFSSIFETICGIKEGSDELNFFYISELQKVINASSEEQFAILEHIFGLNGHKQKDIGLIIQMKNSTPKNTLCLYKHTMQELKDQRYLYDLQSKLIYVERLLVSQKTDLSIARDRLRKLTSSKTTVPADLEKQERVVETLTECVTKTSHKRDEIKANLKSVKKEYLRFA